MGCRSRLKISGFDAKLVPPMEDLVRALRRLEPEQGAIARRNARRAVGRAGERLARTVNKHYPTERKKPRARRKPRSINQQTKALQEKGWQIVTHRSTLHNLSAAGIRTRCIKIKERNVHTRVDGTFVEIWAPSWAVQIATAYPSKLAACRRKIGLRKAILTEIALAADSANREGGSK